MFPDFDDEEFEDLKSLVSWGLPGYALSKGESSMPTTKKKAPAKKAAARKPAGKTSKSK